MNNLLNNYLADLVVEYHKLQNFHWYVKGKDFFTVHAKLEDLYNSINSVIDEVAENILMIGGQPLASLKDFSANAKIKEAEAKHIKSKEVFVEVLADFEYLLNSSLAIKKAADDENNYIISALMDDYIQNFSKNIWMINQVVEN